MNREQQLEAALQRVVDEYNKFQECVRNCESYTLGRVTDAIADAGALLIAQQKRADNVRLDCPTCGPSIHEPSDEGLSYWTCTACGRTWDTAPPEEQQKRPEPTMHRVCCSECGHEGLLVLTADDPPEDEGIPAYDICGRCGRSFDPPEDEKPYVTEHRKDGTVWAVPPPEEKSNGVRDTPINDRAWEIWRDWKQRMSKRGEWVDGQWVVSKPPEESDK